jgi:hypothetical protein
VRGRGAGRCAAPTDSCRLRRGRVWDPPLPRPAPSTIRYSQFAIRRSFPLAARCSLLAVFSIHHSLFAIRNSPFFSFAIRGFSPILARPRKWVSNNACVGVQERRPGFGIVSDSLAMSQQGGLRTRPYPDPTIRHSQFAVSFCSLLAARCSPFFSFAIRCACDSRFAIPRQGFRSVAALAAALGATVELRGRRARREATTRALPSRSTCSRCVVLPRSRPGTLVQKERRPRPKRMPQARRSIAKTTSTGDSSARCFPQLR